MGDDAVYMSKLAKALTSIPSDWSPDTHFCNWSGIVCDDSSRVVNILLDSMLQGGTLPSDLNLLSKLSSIFLQNNSLSGPLPSLASLTMLQIVDLGDNNFTSIPNDCFKGLSSLRYLRLTNNNLAPWTFPIDLTQSSNLQRIELESTNMMGSLPDIFAMFPNLNSLFLSYNNLTWVLPQSLVTSVISFLWLDNQKNGLSGTIDVLSMMSLFLNNVQLQNNRFTGPIPNLSNCTNLQTLHLHDNNLTGVVPSSLTALSNLDYVSLDNNRLQGPMPAFRESVIVTLGGTNSFCQTIVAPCDPQVTTLLEIAAAFGYPILLADAWVGNNPCGNWNFIMCQDEKIIVVNLAKQNLTGTISPAFSSLTDLRMLDLSGNYLSGSILVSLTTMPQLEALDVSNNNLSRSCSQVSTMGEVKYYRECFASKFRRRRRK
ncbi:hypothetical protein RIF29_14015 [Crotalaria pallida]|uniref:Leucine-rich repeat-containing N-terminal plant-type domain-containing protein n=1 Tax=Crotalaria pallida TaxID=3830 RepID=A0AAN9FG52_CROPI